MASWVAIVISLLSIGIAAVSLGFSIHQWRTSRERHRALGNVEQTRESVFEARRRFEVIIAQEEGMSADYFDSEENNQTGRRLRDAADRTTDPALCTLLSEAAEAWNNARDHAPPPRGPRLYSQFQDAAEYRQEDAEMARQMKRVVECAGTGLAKCKEALARVNELDRTL
jgi:hypothetical protein